MKLKSRSFSIDILDKVLNYVKERSLYGLTEDDNPDFTDEENTYLFQVIKRLETDGYLYSEYKNIYVVSFNGLMALDDSFLSFYKNRPYKLARLRSRIKTTWLVVKIILISLNSLLLLILAVLTFLKEGIFEFEW